MKHSITITALLALLATAPAYGHGSGQHVKGTVASLNGEEMVVNTGGNHTVAIHLDDRTLFRNAKGSKTNERPHVADRVAVDVREHGQILHATSVRFARVNENSHDQHEHGGEHTDHSSHH